ncbi:hypothetical protein [Adlercreutzia sp. ZJ141]|uniref:hypothetical protein n=1 Tax=Adlercreutzia sp. ZJ141 TaxID=2709406 RepID=UPI0013EB745B|nr:hypothetical protein [Adlercreutzia sp. ZJ141]
MATTEVTNFPRESTLVRIADALERNHTQQVLAQLDGTVTTYRKCMRDWFLYRGAARATPRELTELCNEWYAATRTITTWCGGVEFYQPTVSAVSTGERFGDNVGMTCVPSTDTVANTDDYAGEPLFVPTDVNWTLDATGKRLITAIDGITSNFRRRDTSVYVGVMQMAPWYFEYADNNVYARGIAAQQSVDYDVHPLVEAVQPDGTLSEFVLHPKYAAHKLTSGALTSCAGVVPSAWMSHNAVRSAANVNGARYSGECACDASWLILMANIKYASLTLDGILQGCCQNNYQYPAALAETGVKRVLLTAAQGAVFEPGMGVLIGNYTTNVDRSYLYSITGTGGAIVTAVEPVTVGGVDYTAVYVDVPEAFDTAANGAATAGTTYISSFHWATGTTDGVRGNDGSPKSCTSGKYPAKLQGVEYMVGAYEVIGDAIFSEDTQAYSAYTCSDATKQASSVTADYVDAGLRLPKAATAGWAYIKKQGFSCGVTMPTVTGGSSSTYTRDAFYSDAAATTGLREVLLFGSLFLGAAPAGLSCGSGLYGLGNAHWYIVSRLSPNGNRGEYDALAA